MSISLKANADGTTGAIQLNGVDVLSVGTSGNVGIGTSSPTFQLETTSSAKIGTYLGINASPSTNIRLYVNQGADYTLGTNYGLYLQGSGYAGGISLDATSMQIGHNSAYRSLTFHSGTSFAERMRIDSSGNLLIGTTSGSYLLTVAAGRGGFKGSQNVGTLRTAAGSLGGLECFSASTADAAFMCFHKPGNYASYFGLDTDNWFAVGGWSAGAGLANFKCGALSKASGSFKIDHPLPEKTETHHLVHSFVEAPQADNIYRGKVTLVDGYAEINIDESAGMTEGTFVALNREVQCFTSNESHWDAVRGSVNGNILTIECQSTTSTATVSWLVIGERHDKHMYDTSWTDENGKVIVEPLKPPKP